MQSHERVVQVFSGWAGFAPKIKVGPESDLLVTLEVDTGISQKQ